jgi:hypothetical protein
VSFALDALVRRLDPCEDPTADPLTAAELGALLAATSVAVFLFLGWKFQPMQDLGHHLAMASVYADWGREDSLYTDLYTPPDRLAANSLLYTVAGALGPWLGVTRAVRADT